MIEYARARGRYRCPMMDAGSVGALWTQCCCAAFRGMRGSAVHWADVRGVARQDSTYGLRYEETRV